MGGDDMNNGRPSESVEEIVVLLRHGQDFQRISEQDIETGPGPVRELGIGQRVILDADMTHCYVVETAGPVVAGRQVATLRRGRPILDTKFIEQLFGSDGE